MTCTIFPLNALESYKYVVNLSRYHGKFVLSRHKEQTTWEMQGGHVEPDETPLEAAKRELYEEFGDFPESEMKEISFFDHLPENLTYPAITPILYREAGFI